MTDAAQDGPKLNKEERLAAYQKKLSALKERSALREVMERELLLEFIRVNHGNINEYPLIKAQQQTVIGLLCGRTGHPGYEYIHKHIADFIVQLGHWGKAIKVKDTKQAATLQVELINQEALLLRCVQGIVYAMALITDNFEEIVLRYFGQNALQDYSKLIEENTLDQQFWTAFIEQFIASRVEEAHREILVGKKYEVVKEKNFLVIRFLFDDILSKLNPTNQQIEKTRIQQAYVKSRTEFDGRKRAKFIQNFLTKRLATLSQAKQITAKEFLQAGRVTCIDPIGEKFETKHQERLMAARARQENPGQPDERDAETIEKEEKEFKFLMEQIVAAGVGASIAVGRTSDHLFKALEEFVPDQIAAFRPLAKDFSIPTLETILFFLMEKQTVQILQETGRKEGGKIQVRSGRAKRVPESAVDELENMSKIRKKQLFANDVTREGMLLFKAKTVKQLAGTVNMLSLEPELEKGILQLWKEAIYRVDIMVLINLELVAKTTTNLKVKLSEILDKYCTPKKIEKPQEAAPQPAEKKKPAKEKAPPQDEPPAEEEAPPADEPASE